MLLKANNQPMTGVKDELIEKIADGRVNITHIIRFKELFLNALNAVEEDPSTT
jgi:hypothetical protein